ncbi:MAG TPA: TRAP transporter small permease subunit [Candidatus Binatia bacterium]|nr:TRAP transporter small permease subunit [Candidatus Binatia bacterium]
MAGIELGPHPAPSGCAGGRTGWAARLALGLDQISRWSGLTAAWLVVPMAAVLVWEIVVRKVDRPTAWSYDIATMTYGAHFMLCAAYTLYRHGHIRTDFLYDRWSPRTQAVVDAVFYAGLFLPGMAMFLWLSAGFAYESWLFRERMFSSGRLPVYPFKTVIPVTAALLLLQGVSELIKSVQAAWRGRWT